MEQYNGVSILWLNQKCEVPEFFVTDASLEGIGGIFDGKYFHHEIPSWMKELEVNIAHLEMWAILVGVRAWKSQLEGNRFAIACDNQAVVHIINNGRSHDQLFKTLLRQLTYELATHQIEIVARYIPTKLNVIPDILSRWTINANYPKKFQELCKVEWKEVQIKADWFNINHEW